MKICVRKFLREDAAAVAGIEKACFSAPWSENAIISGAENEGAVFFCAEADGKGVLGYGSMNTVLDEGYVNNIAVLPESRRQGAAGKIVEALIKEGEKRGLSFISLEVRESNLPAIALYEKYGFEKVGKRKNFYDKPTEDALIMTKNF